MAKERGKPGMDTLLGALFTQVDPGTFSGRQQLLGNWYPVSWVHRNPDSATEIWILYRPGSPEGFMRVGTSSQAARFVLDWLSSGQMHTPETFRNWVIGEYARLGFEPSLEDLEVYEYRALPDGDAPRGHGIFQTGAYQVRQVNLAAHPGAVVAWVWRIAAANPREIWLLRDGYYVNPGPGNAGADFHFAAIPGITTDEDFIAHVLREAEPGDLTGHPGFIYHMP